MDTRPKFSVGRIIATTLIVLATLIVALLAIPFLSGFFGASVS